MLACDVRDQEKRDKHLPVVNPEMKGAKVNVWVCVVMYVILPLKYSPWVLITCSIFFRGGAIWLLEDVNRFCKAASAR